MHGQNSTCAPTLLLLVLIDVLATGGPGRSMHRRPYHRLAFFNFSQPHYVLLTGGRLSSTLRWCELTDDHGRLRATYETFPYVRVVFV